MGIKWATILLQLYYGDLVAYSSSLNHKASKYWSKGLPLYELEETDENYKLSIRSSRISLKL